jgi:hypothetical protein
MFWVEETFTAVYLLNRYLTITVKQKTPEETWSRIKPGVSHINVFGSTSYAWIPYEKRAKFVKILCNCKEYFYPLLWIKIKYIYY